jgi:hypothetical protein
MPSAVISLRCSTNGTVLYAPSASLDVNPTVDIPVFGISLGTFAFVVIYFDVRA